MGFNFLTKPPGHKAFRIAALIYGLVFVNAGALVLYEKFSQPPVVFDKTFGLGLVCLLLGLVGLWAARRSRNRPS